MRFQRVAGGNLHLGINPQEEAALHHIVSTGDEDAHLAVAELVRDAGPMRSVHVRPFWSSLTLVSHGIASRLIEYSDRVRPFWASSEGDTPACFTTQEVEELLAAVDGVRLLTEAEWQYIARTGGKSPWVNAPHSPADVAAAYFRDCTITASPKPATLNRDGFWGLGLGEWVRSGERTGPQLLAKGAGARTFPWQHPAEVLSMHASAKVHVACGADDFCVRFALLEPQ